MNIAFTICSNNYLAHAKTLGDSFLKFHPEMKFIIGLVDKYHADFDYGFFSEFKIIPVEELAIPEFSSLHEKYNITELNTAVKPSYLHHIFQNYKADKVLYIDPDIMVTSRFDEVLDTLDSKNIVITPHMCSPIDDEFSPTDYHVLRGGVFNLGFIGLSKYEAIKEFISWWHVRVVKYGFESMSKGMFYDQLWINYVPTFYDNYHILKHLGYNMANWNLHERVFTDQDEDQYVINNKYPLRFFHFSSFKYKNPNSICAYLTRFNFENRPDLVPIFDRYTKTLTENNIAEISKLKVFYYPNLGVIPKEKSLIQKVSFRVKSAITILIKGHC
jgi:hypothetical protein